MADYVTIANQALSWLGENDQLRDPDQDSGPARSVAAVWERVRRACLRDHPWNFAVRRKYLNALNEDVIAFDYAFQLPVGSESCLRLLEILSPVLADTDWQIEGGRILANTAGPLAIRYVGDVTDVALWDDLFCDAFAAKLAHQICDRITGDLSRQDAMMKLYAATLSKAKGVDAKENPPLPFEDSSWLTARWVG